MGMGKGIYFNADKGAGGGAGAEVVEAPKEEFFDYSIKKIEGEKYVIEISALPKASGLLFSTRAADISGSMLRIQEKAIAECGDHKGIFMVLNLRGLGVPNPFRNGDIEPDVAKMTQLALENNAQLYICALRNSSSNPINDGFWTVFSRLVVSQGQKRGLSIENWSVVGQAVYDARIARLH